MTMLLYRDHRRSRFLFDLSARYCLERNALDAITGQAATFARAGLDASFASNGLLYPVGYSQPSYRWGDADGDGVLEPHLWLQDTATNVALHKRDLTNAAYTKTSCTAALDQVGIDGKANAASSLLATGANGTCIQNITLGSSARAQSAYVKRITGSGAINMTTDNGVTWTVITLTSAWARVTIPVQTLANPKIGFRIVTNGDKIAVDWVQNETTVWTGPIGGIADNAATETRAAGTLTYPFLALPAALTIYVKFIELGTLSTGVASGLIGIGASTNPAMSIESTPGVYAMVHRRTGNVISSLGAGPTIGQFVEVRGILNADGSVQIGQSIAGAAETTGAASAANALAAAWNDTTLTIGSRGAGTLGYNAVSQVRIAAGVQTLAFMREG